MMIGKAGQNPKTNAKTENMLTRLERAKTSLSPIQKTQLFALIQKLFNSEKQAEDVYEILKGVKDLPNAEKEYNEITIREISFFSATSYRTNTAVRDFIDQVFFTDAWGRTFKKDLTEKVNYLKEWLENEVQEEWLENEVQETPSVQPELKVPETLKDINETLKLKDKSNNEILGTMALPSGRHNIVIQFGTEKNKATTLETISPIYFFQNAQLEGMYERTHCIVMNKKDFELIKKTIHPGAFGGDYCVLDDSGLVVVWKHPADLRFIDGYNPPQVAFDVGTYAFCNDTDTENWSAPPIQGNATKLRTDIKEEGSTQSSFASVHNFVGKRQDNGSEFNLPGISTGNFFNDFNRPKPEELSKVKQMITELEKLGIYAFMSNSSHHAIILYAYDTENTKKQALTPSLMATQLQENPAILEAISKAAVEGKDMGQWKRVFIRVFGDNKENTSASMTQIEETQSTQKKELNIQDQLNKVIQLIKEASEDWLHSEPESCFLVKLPLPMFEEKGLLHSLRKLPGGLVLHTDENCATINALVLLGLKLYKWNTPEMQEHLKTIKSYFTQCKQSPQKLEASNAAFILEKIEPIANEILIDPHNRLYHQFKFNPASGFIRGNPLAFGFSRLEDNARLFFRTNINNSDYYQVCIVSHDGCKAIDQGKSQNTCHPKYKETTKIQSAALNKDIETPGVNLSVYAIPVSEV